MKEPILTAEQREEMAGLLRFWRLPPRNELAVAMADRLAWCESELERLVSTIDHFLNIDLDMGDCLLCDYDPDSITPMDGHADECPIRRLAEATR